MKHLKFLIMLLLPVCSIAQQTLPVNSVQISNIFYKTPNGKIYQYKGPSFLPNAYFEIVNKIQVDSILNLYYSKTQSDSKYEVLSNKSTNTALGSSDVLYPTQKAVRDYVTSQVGSSITVFGRTSPVVAQNNDYTFSQIGSKPTTLNGYGITDAYPLIGNPSGFITGYTETDPNVPAYAKGLSGFSVIKANTDPLYAPIAGSSAYVQSSQTQQINSNFNVSGTGAIGTTLSVGGNINVNAPGASNSTTGINFVGGRALMGWDGTLGVAYIKGSDNSKVVWIGGGTTEYNRSTSTTFQPGTNNASSLGTQSLLWSNVFSALSTSGQYKLSALNTAPASATATGTLGEIRITATFIYVCSATNTWVRSPLSTW